MKDNGSSQVKLDGYLERMNKWFYYGFVKRFDLSDCHISGAGQKRPTNWENALVDVGVKVRARQKPATKLDRSTRIACVRDAYFCNTDHVPVWYETVGNYTWGKKSGGRRHIQTGGKDKDKFTAQLSIGKDGRKLIPFFIFRGEFLFIFISSSSFSCLTLLISF